MTEQRNIISLRNAGLSRGGKVLWQQVNLEVAAGEFIAVLGPNGAGKTSFLRVLLGLTPLSEGSVTIQADCAVGYIPQQKIFDPHVPVRGRDLVAFGLDGARYGVRLAGDLCAAERIDQAIEEVGAASYANRPVGQLSGGEQQRLRVAQALLCDPQILLCDEPLHSLDPPNQQEVSRLIGQRCREKNTAVVFVTHDINPILPLVDRVLYFAGSRWAIGTPQEILTAATLSQLYNFPIKVIQIEDRIIIFTGAESTATLT